MPLSAEARAFINEVTATYEVLLCAADSRIQRGAQLWGQFREVVAACADNDGQASAVVEKVNELAVARELALDPTLSGPRVYEPDILPSGRKIDFVAERGRDDLYVEVKSIKPQGGDGDENYRAYLERRKLHPSNVRYIVAGEIGGTVYANSFRARSKFLTYSLDFESRLAEAKDVAGGPGVLVFCGSGVHWALDELEDFSDFYHSGHHRQDDPFL
jgi:hypothetical protein